MSTNTTISTRATHALGRRASAATLCPGGDVRPVGAGLVGAGLVGAGLVGAGLVGAGSFGAGSYGAGRLTPAYRYQSELGHLGCTPKSAFMTRINFGWPLGPQDESSG